MNVIVVGADLMRWAGEFAERAGEVFREFVFDFDAKPRVAIFGGEDEMEQNV
jgi:hypothetical protein